MQTFYLGSKLIGADNPTYIIAEMSGNHGGSLARAKEIIRAAKSSGADAVKLQTYLPETITLDCDQKDFLLPATSPWSASRTYYDLYKEAYTPWEWHGELFATARECEIDVFSSPFCEKSVDLLEELGAPAYKIASPEINHIPLLERVAKTGKPIILSTGVASYDDLALAVNTLRQRGASEIVVLKCTTAYPANHEQLNLRTIAYLANEFGIIAGLSDHSQGSVAAILSVGLGAKVIEKHITLSNADETVDSFFSMSANEFTQMVSDVRLAENALGKVSLELDEITRSGAVGRRSLYVADSIKAGEKISAANIRCVRPHYGMHPKHYHEVIGMVAKRNLRKGDRLQWEDLKEN
jgi:N-acetylneuraminate synthase/pseudaminic acid synthase